MYANTMGKIKMMLIAKNVSQIFSIVFKFDITLCGQLYNDKPGKQ